MHEDEHRVKIELAKCEDPTCECKQDDDYLEGTVEEVLEQVYREGIERDEAMWIALQELAQHITVLYAHIDRIENPRSDMKFGFGDANGGTNGPTMN